VGSRIESCGNFNAGGIRLGSISVFWRSVLCVYMDQDSGSAYQQLREWIATAGVTRA